MSDTKSHDHLHLHRIKTFLVLSPLQHMIEQYLPIKCFLNSDGSAFWLGYMVSKTAEASHKMLRVISFSSIIDDKHLLSSQ